MWFINITVTSSAVGRVSHAYDFNFSSFDFELDKTICKVPAGEKELILDHSGDSKLLKTLNVSLVEFLEDIFHFLVVSDLCDSNLLEKTDAFLHSFIETDILCCKLILVVVIPIHNGIILIII